MPAKPPNQPPSFTPGGQRHRPSDDDARPVGDERQAARRPQPPRTTPGSAGAPPPAITPRVQASPAPAARAPQAPATQAPARRPAAGPTQRASIGCDPRPSKTDPAEAVAAPKRHRGRRVAIIGALLLAALLAWSIGLLIWANGKIEHVNALSGAPNTPGTTYLITGSDSRADGAIVDPVTTGARTDTIMLLQVPKNGPPALISLPRDSYVKIPGHGMNKLNAAFAWGGAPLLVRTVEGLTGITIDHYVEIGFAGVEKVVDAVGGVRLCLDYNVSDKDSGLRWTAGCHEANGPTALSFARMRHADPTGDIGRAQRQRQIVSAVTSAAAKPSLIFQPNRQVQLIDAGVGALVTSDGTDIVDLARLALAFRAAGGKDGITGTPPIASMDYRPGAVGSTVRLDPALTPAFFQAIKGGTLPPGPVGGAPTP